MVIDLSKRPRPQQCTAVIESKIQLTKNVWLVNFRLQNPSALTFLPGQTISLHASPNANRSMSISSPPSDATHVLMVHDVSPMGPGSQWTLNHNVGDVATFMAPLGIFILDKSPRKKVFVATGTGIAPYRSMLLEDAGKFDITLYWGLRHEEDVYWKEEFEAMEKTFSNFHFKLTLSRPTDSWSGLRGHVTEQVMKEETKHKETDFYLCGNKEMVKELDAKLVSLGVPRSQIYRELYF